jgi:hypothetical protein
VESSHPPFCHGPPHPFIRATRVRRKPRSLTISNTQNASARRSANDGEPTGSHASPRPHIRRAQWHSFWVRKKNQPDARSVTLKWLRPIPVNVTGVEDLMTTVRDVGDSRK